MAMRSSGALYIHEKQKSHAPMVNVTIKKATLSLVPRSLINANVPKQSTPSEVKIVWIASGLDIRQAISRSCSFMGDFAVCNTSTLAQNYPKL
jgi:hypothetical protein